MATKTQNTVRPTKKQHEILSFIEEFIGEHGYSPSYREIMNGLNYTSVATVALHVTGLIRRGHLRKRTRSARSLEVVNGLGVPITAAPPVATTQSALTSEERWLIAKVEKMFAGAETATAVTAGVIADLQAMLKSLQLLGMDQAAEAFTERLAALEGKEAVRGK